MIRQSVLAALTLAACEAGPDPGGFREELLDPDNCKECHPEHHRQWLGSMHAYAAEDPVFLAMNARGQRETGGALGDFCVRCHAPVAVALGKTTDGLNLDELPPAYKGVTCYFCHNMATVDGMHNNPITLAMDGIMRAEVSDPIANEFHLAEYSDLVDAQTLKSSAACGSCHDIVNGNDVHLERTFAEWRDSFYSDPDPDNPQLKALYGNTCSTCHMYGKTSPIADYDGVPTRRLYDHGFPGIDLSLTDFPDAELGPALREEQRAAIDDLLAPSVCVGLCVRPPENGGDGTDIVVWLHNEASGHFWPSGATQDRRAWVELQAFSGDQIALASGVVDDQSSIDAAAAEDPTLWLFRDITYDAAGDRTSLFWEVADYESNLLVVAKEAGAKYDKATWDERIWHVDGPIDRVSVRMKIRPIPFELFDELEADGLDPALRTMVPTFVPAGTVIEWTPETAEMTDLEGPCVKSATCFDVISMSDAG